MPAAVIHAFGHLKAACARANLELGKLDEKLAEAIIAACEEVAAGKHDDHFPVDIYQTGSGTSTNMNANEVIANLANQRLGIGIGAKGKEGAVHPNDHVNMGQSSNDTFPAAMHIAAAMAIARDLIPALERLHDDLAAKAKQWDKIVKIGRTHLMDATPIRVGQVFSGYAAQAEYATMRASRALKRLEENMPIGGTAVGTGINTHPKFAAKVCVALSQRAWRHVHRGGEPSRGPGGQGFVRRSPRRAENDRRVALENRQRHPPARLRPALRHFRAVAAGDAAGLLDHAGQSESGDCGIGDPGRLPRDGQRRRRDHRRRWAASARCSS